MGIHAWQVDSHHKMPVIRKAFPCPEEIMLISYLQSTKVQVVWPIHNMKKPKGGERIENNNKSTGHGGIPGEKVNSITLRRSENDRYFADNISKHIFEKRKLMYFYSNLTEICSRWLN